MVATHHHGKYDQTNHLPMVATLQLKRRLTFCTSTTLATLSRVMTACRNLCKANQKCRKAPCVVEDAAALRPMNLMDSPMPCRV